MSATRGSASGAGSLWRDLSRVIGLWRPRFGWLALGAAVAAASALIGVALLAFAGTTVVAALSGATLGLTLLLLRPLAVLRPAVRWAERMVSHAATFRALADTRVWFFRRLSERLPGGLGLGRAGDLLGRIVADVEALDGLYLRALVPAVVAVIVVGLAAAVLGMVPTLAVIVVVPLLVALLLPLVLAPAAARAATDAAAAQGRLRTAAVDPFLGLEDTLAANAEPRAAALLGREAAVLGATQRRLAWPAAWAGVAGSLLVQAALLGAIGWGLSQASGSGAVPPEAAGLAVLGLFLAIAAGDSLGLLPRAGVALASAGSGARRLFEAADAPIPVPEPAAPVETPVGFGLRLEGVRFAWAQDRAPVFAGLDLDIPEGTHLALLGPSGAGKSTLAALLLKLAAPGAGRITLDGVDLADLPAEAVRRRITCLTQDARLFDDSIAANLRIAAPLAPDAALWRALDRAGIAAVVRALPEGLETRCGEGGARFSGGQARRLALARVLLSAAPVVILDEPTAGLDAETERAFLETLEAQMAGRTVILITHRLTGVEKPSRILRLAGGQAVPAMG